jgi:hypothetical protein
MEGRRKLAFGAQKFRLHAAPVTAMLAFHLYIAGYCGEYGREDPRVGTTTFTSNNQKGSFCRSLSEDEFRTLQGVDRTAARDVMHAIGCDLQLAAGAHGVIAGHRCFLAPLNNIVPGQTWVGNGVVFSAVDAVTRESVVLWPWSYEVSKSKTMSLPVVDPAAAVLEPYTGPEPGLVAIPEPVLPAAGLPLVGYPLQPLASLWRSLRMLCPRCRPLLCIARSLRGWLVDHSYRLLCRLCNPATALLLRVTRHSALHLPQVDT